MAIHKIISHSFNIGILILLISSLLIQSCKKDIIPAEDFRDSLIGNYECIETYFYPDGDNEDGTIKWITDTIRLGVLIKIDPIEDSLVEVSIDNESFIVKHLQSGDFFYRPDQDRIFRVWFFDNDSINVLRQSGVAKYLKYFGNKI